MNYFSRMRVGREPLARVYIDWCKDTTNYRNGKGKGGKYSLFVHFLAVAVP